MACHVHADYIYNMLQKFITELKNRPPDWFHCVPTLHEIGWEKGNTFMKSLIFTAKIHLPLVIHGFRPEWFEMLGEQLVEMLVMNEFVQVAYFHRAKHRNSPSSDMSRGSSRVDALFRVCYRRTQCRIRSSCGAETTRRVPAQVQREALPRTNALSR